VRQLTGMAVIGRKVAKQQKPYYHSYYYYCVTVVDFEVARMSRFGLFWHFKALNAMAPVFMRMLISAWTNGEPASWYAMRFGLPETESVVFFIRLVRKLRSMKCPFGFDVRPIPAE
jgi:hypothetical protein